MTATHVNHLAVWNAELKRMSRYEEIGRYWVHLWRNAANTRWLVNSGHVGVGRQPQIVQAGFSYTSYLEALDCYAQLRQQMAIDHACDVLGVNS